MKMSMLKVGDADKDGEREYTFQVMVNRQPVIYQVKARHEHDASDRLSRYVEGDAAVLQELGAGETGATIVLLGAVAAGAYVVYRHFRSAKPKAKTAQGAAVKAAKGLINNGTEVAAPDDDTDGAPDDAEEVTVQASRSSKSPFTATSARSSMSARSFNRQSTRVAAGEVVDAPVTSWRPLAYHGAQGQIAGGDPTKSLRIVVFSDLPADQFLTLARPSSYDAARGQLNDAISVLAFPTAAADNVRSPDSVEVMIGGSPTRDFDVTAATPAEALSSVRTLIARYL